MAKTPNVNENHEKLDKHHSLYLALRTAYHTVGVWVCKTYHRCLDNWRFCLRSPENTKDLLLEQKVIKNKSLSIKAQDPKHHPNKAKLLNIHKHPLLPVPHLPKSSQDPWPGAWRWDSSKVAVALVAMDLAASSGKTKSLRPRSQKALL